MGLEIWIISACVVYFPGAFSINLAYYIEKSPKNLDELTLVQREKLLAYAFERYFQTAALFGTPSSCLKMVNHLKEIGVDEIACLIDFGVDEDSVLSNLGYLNKLRKLANGISDEQTSEEAQQQTINPLEENLDLANSEELSKSRADNLIKWLRSYASERINSRLIDERRCIPPYIVLDFGNRGLLGMQVPPEYGGIGLNYRDTLRVFEQLAAIDLTLASFVGVHHALGTRPIMNYANETVRKELLPLIAQGRELAGFAITEPVAGSNPRAITTSAIADNEGGWRLSGQKSWIGHGSWAGAINIFVQMLDANNKPIGISGFVVRQGTKGLRQGPEALTMGMRGMVQNSIYLQDVPVSAENLLGEVGKGMEVAQDAMMFGRLGLGVMSLGGMKRCAQLILRYSDRRLVSTGRLLDNPVTLVRLSNLTAAITALETLVFKIAELLDRGQYIPEEAYTACKTSGPEFLGEAADHLVQLLGGRGYIETNIAPQILRDARLLRIFEGPTETLNMFLGSRAINKGEELQQFLSKVLGMAEVAQRLTAATTKINEHIKGSQSSLSDQNSTGRWVYFLTGELTTFAILLAVVQRAFEDNASEDLRHAKNWAELQFEQKLKSILSGTPSELVVENADAVIAQIPDADTITARINDYVKTIGNLEQTLAGEDHELDELLRCQTYKIESLADTNIKLNNNEDAENYINKVNYEYKKPVISDVNSIQNLIKNRLTKKLKIDASSIKSHATFVSYGIDSVMAVELIQDLEYCLNQTLEATLLWNFPTIESLAEYLAQGSDQNKSVGPETDCLLHQNESEKEEWIEGEL